MPLLTKSINPSSIVCQYINIVFQFSKKSLQPPVITADQPVFALSQKVQWMQPERHNKCVIMVGPLHIEMVFLSQ